jgi:hypothetical protein
MFERAVQKPGGSECQAVEVLDEDETSWVSRGGHALDAAGGFDVEGNRPTNEVVLVLTLWDGKAHPGVPVGDVPKLVLQLHDRGNEFRRCGWRVHAGLSTARDRGDPGSRRSRRFLPGSTRG